MAQRVKPLLHKPNDPSSNPQNPQKIQGAAQVFVIHAHLPGDRQKQERPRDLDGMALSNRGVMPQTRWKARTDLKVDL